MRVERFASTEPVPVKQAQLIDPGAFPFSTASAEALGQMGKVFEELGKRKLDMQDRIGVSNITAAMEDAEREYQKEIIEKPLEEHATILIKHRNNAMASVGQQRLSADVKTFAENKLRLWGDLFADVGEIKTLKAMERDATIRVTTDYTKALVDAGGDEDNPNVVEAKTSLVLQYTNTYTPAEAKVMVEQVQQQALKQIESNILLELTTLAPVADIDDPSALFDILDTTPHEVLGVIDPDRFKSFTARQQGLLRNDAKTIANDRIKQAKAKLDNIQRLTDISFFTRYGIDLKPSDIPTAVSEHRLSREAGDRWLTRLADPRDFPTDPATEALITKRLFDPGDPISESDILDLIGKPKGLSNATARRFIADMDFFADPWFKRADSFLKSQLGWDGAYEKFAHPVGGLSYKLASDKLFESIKAENLKGRDIYDRGTLIAIPFIVDYWESALILEKPEIERMKTMLMGELAEPKAAEPKTPTPTPATKRENILDPERIF